MSDKETFATILFLDIMNSSEYANVLSVEEYFQTFLKEFQETVLRTTALYFSHESSGIYNSSNYYVDIAGDEARIFLFSDNRGLDVQTALNLAVLIKMSWLTGNFNRVRINHRKPPEDLGVGINSGYLYRKENGKLEGFAINLAKRIENHSRLGHSSKIMIHKISRTILDSYIKDADINMCITIQCQSIYLPQHYFYEFTGNIELKGIAQPIPMYEVQYINWGEMPFFMEELFIEKLTLISMNEFIAVLAASRSVSVLNSMINNILMFIAIKRGMWDTVIDIAKSLYENLSSIMEIPFVAGAANIIMGFEDPSDMKKRLAYGKTWLEIARMIRPHASQIDALEKILQSYYLKRHDIEM